MGEIKSALEIALERTKSVEGNPEALEADKYKKEGKTLVSKFLDDPDFDLKGRLNGFEKKQMGWVTEGVFQVLQANIVLPQDQLGLKKIRRVGEACFLVMRDKKLLSSLFSQLETFYEEYLAEKDRLREALVQQYTPRLKQKEEELAKKMGIHVQIDLNADPEFNALLRKSIGQLEDRYQAVLDQVKDKLNSIYQSER